MLTNDKLNLIMVAKEITLAIVAREPMAREITSAHVNTILNDIHANLVKLSKIEVK